MNVDVEQELLWDLIAFGTCAYRIVDGKKVRVEVRELGFTDTRIVWVHPPADGVN